jgi:hypothetical protein
MTRSREMSDNERCGPYLKVTALSENEREGGEGRIGGDWERCGRSSKEISSCSKEKKVLCYFTGEDMSSFHFTDSSLIFYVFFIKSLYIKYLIVGRVLNT